MQKNSTEFDTLRRAGFQKWVNGLREKQGERFWNRVKKGKESDCWPFAGSRCKAGYGRVMFNGKVINAHQVAYILTHGDYDRSLDVCHQCDNRPCCNPNHLWLGTRRENMLDMYKKGRHKKDGIKGVENTKARLTDSQVLEIRTLHSYGLRQRAIATMFGVNWRTINLIVLRINWKHI